MERVQPKSKAFYVVISGKVRFRRPNALYMGAAEALRFRQIPEASAFFGACRGTIGKK
ncbi:hypothetical protein J2X76_004771 [Neorhizobium sp. 2083]|uniref:hypothetical protein n=1 Tax=Neorhizobium sp. 2083 TaxID=2817762 RepID=UPI00285FD8C2|nr:hypothetical protein [Neorhizobium sp. 2083]MDR6819579.1 hypothetical protein [Neorhizobium sp. 2083]